MNGKHHIAATLVTAPASEPLGMTSDIKPHLRITHRDEDWVLAKTGTAVRRNAEDLTGRKFVTQTWKAFYAQWPECGYFEVPFPPLQSVTHVKYYGTDGTAYTWDSSNYIVDTDSEPGRVTLGYAKSWPSTALYPSNPIEIQFVCGYGAPADVPEDLKTVLKFMVEQVHVRPDDAYNRSLERVIQSVLNNYKVSRF